MITKKWKAMNLLKLAILSLLVFFALPSSADTTDTTKVSVQLTVSGTPVSGITVYAVTYQEAYVNISSGKFSDDILKSSEWKLINEKSENIKVAGYTIGNRVTHTEKETLAIISELFKTNYELLQTINESNNGIFGTFTAPSNFTKMNAPSSVKKQYTDSNGIAEATVKTGLIAFVDSTKKLLYLTKVNDQGGQVKIDVNSPQGMSLLIKNLNSYKTSTSLYTVDYNQSIEYQLILKKELFDSSDSLFISLKPDANLIIDETSIANNKTDLIPPIITSPIPFDPNSGKEQLEKVAKQIGDSYIKQKISTYNIKVPNTGSDVTITIKAHVTPTVFMSRTVQQGVADSTNPNGKSLNIPINAFDLPDSSFGMSISVFSFMGELIAKAPEVNTSGINFVEADAKKETLATGATYLLGEKRNDGYYLYDTLTNWQKVSNLSGVDVSKYFLIKGGNKYIIGLQQPQQIPVNDQRFNYDFNKNTQINQSLIQILGLGKGNYFLYQVSPAKGYEKKQSKIDFSVFRTYGTTSNGQEIKKSSLGYSANQSFKLNTLIPDYKTTVNEYNLLPVSDQEKQSFNKWMSIIFPIVVMVLLIFSIGILLVRVV